jgi:drug/metabolite transporter (DMT)-like permease
MLIPVFFLANMFFFYFAFDNTTIANAVLTHYTAPIFVALIAPVFLKEKILKTTWLAILISSVGLWFITVNSDGVFQGKNERLGIMAGVLSGLTYALLILLIKRIASRFRALFIIFVQNVLIALMLLPFVLKVHLVSQSLPYVVIMGVVHSTVAPLLYIRGIERVNANEAAVLGYLEPVGAIILALFVLHEIPELKALFGGVLILYSGWMILRKRGT